MENTEFAKAVQLSEQITDYVNSYNQRSKNKAFCEAMSNQHRTLQQSFTRLCLEWIEYTASEEYRTDGRNVNTKTVSKKLLDSFKNSVANDMNIPVTTIQDELSKPSWYLPLI